MRLNTIEKELKTSERWGCNDQPYLEWFLGVLEPIVNKISKVDMDDATLHITFSTVPTFEEGLKLAHGAHADECDMISPDTLRLWWD